MIKKVVVLFFLVSLLFTVNTSFAGINIVPTKVWEGGISVHQCPVENWDEYTVKSAPHFLGRTIKSIFPEQNSAVYIKWPTSLPVEVICTPKEVYVKTPGGGSEFFIYINNEFPTKF